MASANQALRAQHIGARACAAPDHGQARPFLNAGLVLNPFSSSPYGKARAPCYTGGMLPLSLHRRAFVKWAAAAPVLATIASRAIVQRAAAATGAETSIDVYRRIGVRP